MSALPQHYLPEVSGASHQVCPPQLELTGFRLAAFRASHTSAPFPTRTQGSGVGPGGGSADKSKDLSLSLGPLSNTRATMTATPPPYVSKWSKILDCMPDGQVLAVSDQPGARTPKYVTQSPRWDWRSQLSVNTGLPCSHPCWSGFILSGLPSVLFASLVLKQVVCTGGCVGEAVPICRTVPSNKPGLLCGQQSPSSVLSEACPGTLGQE